MGQYSDDLLGEIEGLQGMVKVLRDAWFAYTLYSEGPERDWEDEDHIALRRAQNRANKDRYDEQTASLLAGKKRCLVPTCFADMDEED